MTTLTDYRLAGFRENPSGIQQGDQIMKYAFNNTEIQPSVEIYHDGIVYLGEITMREFFWDKEKCAEAWRIAGEKIRAYFGDMLPMRPVSGPPLSYGHLVCLGAPIEFTEDSEPNVKPFISGIDEGIEFLKEKRDIVFAQQPIFRHYAEMCGYLQERFPGQNVGFSGLGSQGPITSAVLMRGQDFIFDIIDEPDKAKEFLSLLTDSIIRYRRLINRINGQPEISPRGCGLADDFASLISPDMWPEFVVPYWNQLYEGLTTGSSRFLHCENLAPAHLRHLKSAKVTYFQPSVSPMLTLEKVRENTDIPIDWLLYPFHIVNMSDEEIQEWVDTTVRAGVTIIRTQFGRFACENGKLDRIKAFYRAFEKYSVK